MPTGARVFIVLGTIVALIGVGLGALGAHRLQAYIAPNMLPVWYTAVEYQMYHALGLMVLGVVSIQLPRSAPLKWAGALMAAGILLFSGSLYLYAFSGFRPLGRIAPAGGLCFIVAWAMFAWAVARGR